MTALRHFALGCCITCAIAGMIRIFWPENAFKPVINTVLLLYILSSALYMANGTDWQAMIKELRRWTTATAATPDYSAYGAELGLQASVQEIRKLLEDHGVQATVVLRGGRCKILLARPASRQKAEEILEEYAGALPYDLLSGGEQP